VPHAAALCAFILIGSLFPYPARAALDCTVKSAGLWLGHGNTYVVPTTTLAMGDFVGTTQFFDILYRCKVSGTPTQWGIVQRTVPTVTNTGQLADWNLTENYPVLTTPQLQQYGLGFAGYYYAYHDWPPASVLTNNNTQPAFWKPLPAADGEGYVEIGVTALYRFLKINNNLDAILDGNPVTVQPLPFALAAFAVRDNESAALSPTTQATASMPTLTIAQRACTPFVNSVKLPAINANELPNIGAVGPPTDFFIQLRCPTNLGVVGYYFADVHGIANEAQGVIAINPASNAKGIGLQITTRSRSHPVYLRLDPPLSAEYQPIKFGPGARYGIYSYSSTGSGPAGNPLADERNYRAHDNAIPLKVAVYRTGDVVPGSYNAAIYIHLVYR